MKTDLLIEILCEELPAIPFLKEKPNILQKWQKIVQEYQLEGDFDFFYTPRRLVIIGQNFPTKQPNQEIEFFGPPIQIAYLDGDKNKGLSKAGESFLRKCDIPSVQTKQKDGKEILYFSKQIQGQESKHLLGEMITKWLESLHFGKSMRWGSLTESFIRPIRNIAILLGNQSIDCELLGIKSKNQTFIHRDFGFEPKKFKSIEEYLNILQNGGVILDDQQRKSKILQELEQIQTQKDVKVELDQDLLAEVTAITESPRVLYGEFDEEFLMLPAEVIITSMKENQRYFALYQDGKIHNSFAVVINSMSEDTRLIIEGNQKVLRARLSDAMFFYQNDLKKPLASYDLSKIAFVEGLGSMQDKIKRESIIAKQIFSQNPAIFQDISESSLIEAVSISKSDLLSEMVGEFPELQGIMGEYYTLAEAKTGIRNRDEKIAKALREQYQPNGEEGTIPNSQMGALLALSYRLDSLMALFSIGKLPSGSKDPYGLRRAGNAILKIIQAYPIHLSMEDLKILSREYQAFDIKKVWDFLLERLEGVLKINASIVRSVIRGREKNLHMIMQKALALNEMFEGVDKEAMLSTFKRVANIIKDMQGEPQEIQSNLFQTYQEQELYKKFNEIKSYKDDPQIYIRKLFSLKDSLEDFFDNVMVNVEDDAIRENRKKLIYAIYWEFLEFGDIKEITV